MYQAPGTGYNPQFGMQQSYPGYQPAWTPNYQNQNYLQQPSLVGRTVGDVSDIRPNEVPGDGTPGIFPLSDLSGILVKSLNADGVITTTVYRPVPQEQSHADIPTPAYITCNPWATNGTAYTGGNCMGGCGCGC